MMLFRFCFARFPQETLARVMKSRKNILGVVLMALGVRLSWWPPPAGSVALFS